MSLVGGIFAQMLGKYLNFGTLQKLPHGSPKWADTKFTSRMSKMRGGGSRALLDSVQKKDAFFMASPREAMPRKNLLPLLSWVPLSAIFLIVRGPDSEIMQNSHTR